jgi:hypothetical protein
VTQPIPPADDVLVALMDAAPDVMVPKDHERSQLESFIYSVAHDLRAR